MDTVRLFVGHDPREAVAWIVFASSVVERSSLPVAVTPLSLQALRDCYGEWHTDGSNDFIYSRFLVPWLCGYEGWAIFADGDMLCRADIADLWAQRDPTKAVQLVKHDYHTRHPVKYLGAKNESYPRKNWSSLVLWNCGHPANRKLCPETVEASTGAFLHRFSWLDDGLIGDIGAEWNWLVDEYPHNPRAYLVHYTLGAPCFAGYEGCDHAAEWRDQLARALAVPEPAAYYHEAVRGINAPEETVQGQQGGQQTMAGKTEKPKKPAKPRKKSGSKKPAMPRQSSGMY